MTSCTYIPSQFRIQSVYISYTHTQNDLHPHQTTSPRELPSRKPTKPRVKPPIIAPIKSTNKRAALYNPKTFKLFLWVDSLVMISWSETLECPWEQDGDLFAE